MNRIVKQIAKECGSVYQPTLESVVASLSISESYECVEDSISKKAYKKKSVIKLIDERLVCMLAGPEVSGHGS
jgi:hypothetical protein